MCTSIVFNANKTVVGFNLDLLDMEYRVSTYEDIVSIDIKDAIEGWLPLFGVNSDGNFIAMPTCWPFDEKSDPKSSDDINVINLDIDLLTKKKSFDEVIDMVKTKNICSVPHITYMSSLTDRKGNVLHIIPGQGYKYYESPRYKVLTNFSPFKMDSELHPWMGLDRYTKANELLAKANDDFDVKDMFEILIAVSQQACPTVVSMVYDSTNNVVYWCMNQKYDDIKHFKF